MNVEELRNYCIAKTGVSESFPFDASTLVFKVANKMFALVGLERQPSAVNLKCNPEYAIELRETYDDAIFPAFHMHKKHWNTVLLESTVAPTLIYQLIDDSYNLVVQKLTKKQKETLLDVRN